MCSCSFHVKGVPDASSWEGRESGGFREPSAQRPHRDVLPQVNSAIGMTAVWFMTADWHLCISFR